MPSNKTDYCTEMKMMYESVDDSDLDVIIAELLGIEAGMSDEELDMMIDTYHSTN